MPNIMNSIKNSQGPILIAGEAGYIGCSRLQSCRYSGVHTHRV